MWLTLNNRALSFKGLMLFFVCLLNFQCADSQTLHFEIETNMGTMKGILYDGTPAHRDEFARLANSGHYDGTLFYRVVKNFVIQGGSSDSRNAKPGQHIGYGSDAVNIDSEFKKAYFHKFGALCAPRQPDKVNVFKTSDISQFYIVRGQVYTDTFLTKYEKSINIPIKNELIKTYYNPHKQELAQLKETDKEAFNKLLREIKEQMALEYRISNYKEFTKEQREAYTTIGGTPQLDGEYTVFGEVTSGLDVMKKINNMAVDANSRPKTDVRIIKVKVY